MMLRFWLVCFGILFVMAQFWQWLREVTIALPVCIIGGIALAIASNWHFSTTARSVDYMSLPPERSNSAQKF